MFSDFFSLLDFFLASIGPIVLMLAPGESDPSDEPPVDPGPTDPPADGTGTDPYSGFAVTCTSVSRTLVSVNQGAHTATYTLVGSYTGNSAHEAIYRGFNGYKDGVKVYSPRFGGGTQESATFYSYTPGDWGSLECDNPLYSWKAFADNGSDGAAGALLTFKSAAVTATASAPSTSSITSDGVTVTCQFYPNTLYSTCTAQLQYKKTVDSTWINAGASAATASYNQQTMVRIATGLDPSTSYDLRLVLTRTTVNETSLTSSTTTFSTLADAPDITTVAASNLASTSAQLNASCDPNTVSTDVSFEWDTNSGAPYANTTSPATTVTGDGAQSVNKAITGLTASTTYYFRAKAVHAGGTLYGSEESFATPADPAADSLEEDHVLTFNYDRKYGVESTVYFSVASPAATSSDVLVTTAPGSLFAANDVKVSKDGGSAADATNLATIAQVTNAPQIYKLVLTATEMEATDVFVRVTDAAGGPAFRDTLIHVRTKQQLGQVDIDATAIGGNTPGFTSTGVGTGAGLIATGGATAAGDIVGFNNTDKLRKGTAAAGGASSITLDASASATTDFYAGQIVSIVGGTGVGQSRVVTAYNGGTKVATVHRSWYTNPSSDSVFVIVPGPDVWEIPNTAELTGMPGPTDSWRKLLTFVFQRFAFKRTQTATTHTMYNAAGSSIITTTVSDAAGTQTFNKLA